MTQHVDEPAVAGSHPVLALDPLTLSLRENGLIEASAGTGKTYTLALLYLRLLLGLGGERAYPCELSVQNILVVTFTEAATEELRNRIRENIHQLRIACLRGETGDAMLTQLLAQIENKAQAALLLLAAERQMDEAAIYTIHGFCQRMLAQNAFQSGMLFQQTLVEDESDIRRQAVADFWRRNCYPLPLSLARAVTALWADPEALLRDLTPYLHGDLPEVKQEVLALDVLLEKHQALLEHIDRVKLSWNQERETLIEIIQQSDVNKRSYSSRNLPNWADKVTQWATSSTQEIVLIDALDNFRQSRLDEKTKADGVAPYHSLFVEIEQLFAEPFQLKEWLLAKALGEVRQTIAIEKQRHAQLGFDDLLSQLSHALAQPQAEQLAELIRKQYPVAMIDEFQDTDPQQYHIFKRVYLSPKDDSEAVTALLLIGDPKQAIYAFRGADIFTYMRARAEVKQHYSMGTNWRSSPDMINAVNHVFEHHTPPFIFAEIPFVSVTHAAKNRGSHLRMNDKALPALSFWIDSTLTNFSRYQAVMAQQCAQQIAQWLTAGQQGEACFVNGKGEQHPVTSGDIAILVRTGSEAKIMREALSAQGIASVYLSNRESVLTTAEARELLRILQAVLTPERESLLRSALASRLFGLTTRDIDALQQDERRWDGVVEEFSHYRDIWYYRGVLPMLQRLLSRWGIAESLLQETNGERRLTDILHLGELLQEASVKAESEAALVRWFMLQIANPNVQAENQQMRLESDRELVQIVTIHKSKGLEYPIVCLPFICRFRTSNQHLYHRRDDYQAVLNFNLDEDEQALVEEERLAEDLRLLYVALTRAIYHCSVGVAPVLSGARRKTATSDLHKSALGYLLQKAEPMTPQALIETLKTLPIALEPLSEAVTEGYQPQLPSVANLHAAHFTRHLDEQWRITSYSGLQQQGGHEYFSLIPSFDSDALGEEDDASEPLNDRFHFPKGAAAGTFLHSLLEESEFNPHPDESWIAEQCERFHLEPVWEPVLAAWLTEILTTPLNDEGLTLAQLDAQHHLNELQFFMPIDEALSAEKIDKLAKKEDTLSAQAPALTFAEVKGMLKGFIDLVFCWQGRYYLLDYKSNWLGDRFADYSQEAMARAMVEHRYDLQYQLYTLALHRFLAHRIPDYDYATHFGGVYYLFLRGLSPEQPGCGVYHCRPSHAFITGLDAIFKGEES